MDTKKHCETGKKYQFYFWAFEFLLYYITFPILNLRQHSCLLLRYWLAVNGTFPRDPYKRESREVKNLEVCRFIFNFFIYFLCRKFLSKISKLAKCQKIFARAFGALNLLRIIDLFFYFSYIIGN